MTRMDELSFMEFVVSACSLVAWRHALPIDMSLDHGSAKT